MTRRARWGLTGVAVALMLGTAACSTSGASCEKRMFVADGPFEGGQASPLEAAQAAAGDGYGVSLPADGWAVVPGGTPSATVVRSGDAEVTVRQLPDRTWSVFEGKACA